MRGADNHCKRDGRNYVIGNLLHGSFVCVFFKWQALLQTFRDLELNSLTYRHKIMLTMSYPILMNNEMDHIYFKMKELANVLKTNDRWSRQYKM